MCKNGWIDFDGEIAVMVGYVLCHPQNVICMISPAKYKICGAIICDGCWSVGCRNVYCDENCWTGMVA
jgi:hypothetical protein